MTSLVPPGTLMVLGGADDPVERGRGRRVTATGGDREAVRFPWKHVIHGFGWK